MYNHECTQDTALELSDEEENIQEGVISCFDGQIQNTQMSRRKTLRSTTKKFVAECLYLVFNMLWSCFFLCLVPNKEILVYLYELRRAGVRVLYPSRCRLFSYLILEDSFMFLCMISRLMDQHIFSPTMKKENIA